MLISRFVKAQLVIFAALTLVATLLIAFVYVRVPTLLGVGRTAISVELPAAGGLYPNANVTYRGVTVGRVTDVTLKGGRVVAALSIDTGHLPPADSRAEVHSVSAIGEQYVDLVPTGGGTGPSIDEGAVIPLDRTSIPTRTGDMLQQVDDLLASAPQQELGTTVDTFADGFEGLGPDLGRLIDNSRELVGAAQQNYEPTAQLLRDFKPFADPQLVSSDEIRNWSKTLAGFTRQVRDSDPLLRSTLKEGSTAAASATDLLKDLSRTTPSLLSTTAELTRLAKAYNKPIEQVLVYYPLIAVFNHYWVPRGEEGALHFNLTTNVNQPQCSEGWTPDGQPGGPRNAMELGDAPLPPNSYCKLPQSDPRVARGARNLECFEPGSPAGRRAATIYECRGYGYRPGGPGGAIVGPQAGLDGRPLFPEPLGSIGGTSTQAPTPEEMTVQTLLIGRQP